MVEQSTAQTHLPVCEVFSSIQGEGITAGTPAIFVRLSGCNLQCVFCFVGNTLISTPKGQKPLDALEIGDTVYGFDFNTGGVIPTQITNTFSHVVGPEDICSVVTGHKKTFCTLNHTFYVKGRGWVCAKELVVGDVIYDLPASQACSLHMVESNPMKCKSTAQKVAMTLRDKYNTGEIIPYSRSRIYNGRTVSEITLCLSDKQKARLGYPHRIGKGAPVTVYNIETGIHNYYANTLLVHNCDSSYTWNWEGTDYIHNTKEWEKDKYVEEEERTLFTAKELVDKICELAGSTTGTVVFTGGEPLLRHKTDAFKEVLQILHSLRYRVEIETNGTIIPNNDVDMYVSQYNVSTKLANSDMPVKKRIIEKAMLYFRNNPKARFKFVIAAWVDIVEVKKLQAKFCIPAIKILLMPEGRTSEELDAHSKLVVEECIQSGYIFCNRLHILLWGGATRGV